MLLNHSLTILIIDDNPLDREIFRRYLLQDKNHQYAFWEAESGREGLALYHQHQPEVILLDYLLPDINGLEFLTELKFHAEAVGEGIIPPVIMLTGQGHEKVAVQAMKSGVNDYLVKGQITPGELQLAVFNAIEKSQLQQEIQKQEQRFRICLENLIDCFGIYSAVRDNSGQIIDFRVDYVNASACENNRMTSSEQVGKNLCELFPSHKETGLFDEYCQVVETGKSLVKESFAYSDTFNDESIVRFFDIQASKLEDGFVASWRNVTEKKQFQEALMLQQQSAYEESETANRVKDQFLVVLSHELRSPLNPILGWAKILKSGNLDDKSKHKALDTIERNVRLQMRLIDDLLDVSRILRNKLTLEMSYVDLVTLIEASVETVRSSAEAKSIQIQTRFNLVFGQVYGDFNRLQQLMVNLLSNAVKFTNSGGRVEVTLSLVSGQEQKTSEAGQITTNDYAEIKVSDTGKGIKAEFLPHVFECFRQEDNSTTRQFGGLGLGLAIVHHLVELHDGTVTAQSLGEGQGATFTVKLPLIQLSGMPPEDGSRVETDVNLNGVKILIVDDDADTREFIKFLLEEHGATIALAASGESAIEIIPLFAPNIILTDLGMPGMDGYSLISQIRAMLPAKFAQIPTVAFTGYATDDDKQKVLAAGFHRHIGKPVDPNELVSLVAGLVSEFQRIF
jgi:signal transduction histidine kinase/DNA-binding response OmpR family regulator